MSEPKYQITPLGFFGKETADELELYFHRMGYNAVVLVAPAKLGWEKVEFIPDSTQKEAKKAKCGDKASIKRRSSPKGYKK